MARLAETEYRQISMGQVGYWHLRSPWNRLVIIETYFSRLFQGQEDSARKMITEAILNGHWLMLQVGLFSNQSL